MHVSAWLVAAEKDLSNSSIPTARLDALVLLEDVAHKDRSWLLANPTHELTVFQIKVLKKLLRRRLDHEPMSYLRGKTEFYGREFVITPAVLEPRPESETMIDCLLKLPGKLKSWPLADVGSGSGAIGITAALELKSASVDLIDIDPKALKVSKMNVDKFTLSLSVIKSDLLVSTNKDYSVLLCNLPYVPDQFHINLAARHEPRLAIFGGKDGLNVYRSLFNQVKNLTFRPLFILTESLPTQHDELKRIAASCDYSLLFSDDFIQVFNSSVRNIG